MRLCSDLRAIVRRGSSLARCMRLSPRLRAVVRQSSTLAMHHHAPRAQSLGALTWAWDSPSTSVRCSLTLALVQSARARRTSHIIILRLPIPP
ncbi:hypothetical protein IE81DRAFT_254905 [Ceraceosorus guamensis]|uniref:Uncharacterized protein n=1 Tax=Ceraceosorus guamensis TaxID=1522189 RepID=A0A316W4K2_9BASI|nr:hypothetical protein IE81DRAFT_254905 [Ceraceosorus guamensis]PWN44800.1 hypothetical protein IE81DRAFT_254905 [Ceraceosorus guamensis]